MPIGSYSAIPTLAAELIRSHPRRVLDLGLGFGFLGAAVRQWVDLGVQPWQTFLAGVEVWPQYRNPLWSLYDIVYVRTIEEHLHRETSRFDMVLLGDVIEHFDEAAARQVLAGVERLVVEGGTIVVITPALPMEQGPAHGNPYEQHRSVWGREKLQALGYSILLSELDHQLPPAVPCLVAAKRGLRSGVSPNP